MLSEFLLRVSSDMETLAAFKVDPERCLSGAGLSAEQKAAVLSADLHLLRRLLFEEATLARSATAGPLASDYTVSISGDTPHCPVNMSGLLHASFWHTMEPGPLWSSEGLTIVGTGIRGGLQTTPEALACIQRTKRVLFLVADRHAQQMIMRLNPDAESMQTLYEPGVYRLEIYNKIVGRILSELRRQKTLCVVFYGHPGAFVYPAHEAMRLAREEGFKARMLPGVSADANLFADLGVDPGMAGVQSYEATNFVLNRYKFDTSAGLILWQIGLFGFGYWHPEYKSDPAKLRVFVEYMTRFYAPEHEVILYEASELPLGAPVTQKVHLAALPSTKISGVATLYVPPRAQPSLDRDMAEKLGLPTK